MSQAHLIFQDTEDNLSSRELSEFLALMEACILACDELKLNSTTADIPDCTKKSLQDISPLQWNSHFETDADDLVEIHSLKRQSPLEIVLLGSMGLIVVAVVLSGGKIKFNSDGFEAELPPLGTGLKALKEALGLDGQVTSGYSIKTVRIKLNKKEFEQLMKQDPSKKGRGGFQNFLIGLQTRVNKKTRELTLGDSDLERIMRYKKKPGKGGFQSRFKKIFGRHFPDE